MERIFIEEQTFDKTDFAKKPLVRGEYEKCTFTGCELSNADLSHIHFSECEFSGCNLSMAKLVDTAFKDVRFKECKLLGLHFNNCSDFLFSVYFDKCVLHLSSFYRLKLKKTMFSNSSLHEVDFVETDLTGSTFDNCDLTMAIFENTILEKADFRTAFNYSIDPDLNRIKKARFSLSGVGGLLLKYDIIIE